MENNNVNSKNKSKKLMALIAGIFVVCMAGLGGIWFLKNNPASKVDLPNDGSNIKKEMTASDEATLRELLLEDAEIAITLTEDVRIDETLYVNGTKKLLGNHSILMELYAEPYQGVLTVSKGADLILDGITIDGNGIANGVAVKFGGGLTCNSADIIYGAPYALDIAGKAVVKDILINESIHTGINVSSDAEVHWEGGTIQNSTNACVAVAKNAYMKISGDSIFEESATYGIVNYGKIDFEDGIVRNAGTYLVYNDGEFDVTYEGESEEDKLEWHTCKMSAVRSGFGAITNIKNLHIRNTGQHGVRLYNTDGGTTVTNCVFEDTKRQAISLLNSTAVLKDIEIVDSIAGIIVQGEPSTLDMENITITNITKGRGIENHSAKVTGKNIVVDGVATYGISTTKDEGQAVGNVTVSDVVIKNCGTDNAFNSNGSEINVTNAQVYNTGRNAIQIVNGGTGTFKKVKVYDTVGLGLRLYQNSKATFTDVQLIRAEKNKDSLVTIDETSVFTMNGKSLVTGCTGRGVYNAGKFIMNGGEISNNGGKNGRLAAGIRIDKKGTFIMNGGSIHDNNSLTAGGGVLVNGTFEMNGGSIYNNKSNNQGGGVHVMKGSTFTMKGGSIVNNVSQNNGGGVWVEENSKVHLLAGEISGNATINGTIDGMQVKGAGTEIVMNSGFKMGSNMIKLTWSKEADKVLLKIVGNKLTKHNTELPLIVTPSEATALGGEVIECDSAESAKNMIDSIVSGDGQFTYYQDDKYIRVEAAHADLDMTGVTDVVAVTNYQQLKEAVTTTKEKRIIKICADIEMEGTISVPNGTTVQLMDDGTKRTLSRADGKVSQFFLTKYGTGLILTGTSEDKLVLDAACSKDADATKLKVLLQMQGASKMENVTFTNSDNSMYSETLIGTYVYQQFASTEITNCTFENGKCNAAGAIRLSGSATIKDSDFINNSAITNEGGAIYVAETGAVLNASGCTFDSNSAVRNGGAIYFREGAGASTITDCEFTNNIATRHNNIRGGAIHVSENVSVELADTRFEGNQAVSTEGDGFGGAISSSGSIKVTDCQFVDNYASSHGGAAFVSGTNASANFVHDDGEAYFEANEAKTWGGGILFNGTKLENISVDGYTFTDNKAGSGAAVNLNAGASAYIANTIFKDNVATNRSGAIDVNDKEKVGSELTIAGCTFDSNEGYPGGAACIQFAKLNVQGATTFTNNKSSMGGAIYLNSTNTDIAEGTVFTGNTATEKGGAFYATAGKVVISGATLTENKAAGGGTAQGGAMFIDKNTTVELTDTKFEKNTVSTATEKTYAYGGAIFSLGNLKATDCQFVENTSTTTAAKDTAAHSGAIHISGANAKTEFAKADGEAVFQGNTATNWGGAIVLEKTALNNTSIAGYTFDGNSAGHGGAIHLENYASAKIDNATFTANKSNGYGGAIDVRYKEANDAELQITNSTFGGEEASQGNFANNEGGAIYGNHIKLTVTGGTFAYNTSGKHGATMNVSNGSEVNLAGVAFKYNETKNGRSGVIDSDNRATTVSQFTITDCTFTENKANGSQVGGAMCLQLATLNINGTTTFTGNRSNTLGGALFLKDVETEITAGAKFIGNNAGTNGGAIYVIKEGANNTSSLGVAGAEFSGNKSVSAGGAVYVLSSSAEFQNAIFSANEATKTGDGAVNGGAIYGEKVDIDITGGSFTGNKAHHGAALNVTNGSKVDLIGVTFTGNQARGRSGVIDINDNGKTASKLTIEGGLFDNNSAAQHGGAMCLQFIELDIKGTPFFKNNKAESKDRSGGVFYLNTVTTKVSGTNVLFESNKAATNGGAIYAANGSLTFEQNAKVTFNKNTATNGGAVYVEGTTFNIQSNVGFQENKASNQGGAIYAKNVTVSIPASVTFEKNESVKHGGAYFANGGSLTINGGVFKNNKSTENTTNSCGGAIFVSNKTTFNMTSGTFEGNSSMFRGGALYMEHNGTIPFTISGGTFRYNHACQGGALWTATRSNASVATISGVVMEYNSVGKVEANTSSGWVPCGGAIYMHGGSANLQLTSVNIHDNLHVGTQLTAETVADRTKQGFDFVFGNHGDSKLYLADQTFSGVISWADTGNQNKYPARVYLGTGNSAKELALPTNPELSQFVVDYTNSKLVTYTPSNN